MHFCNYSHNRIQMNQEQHQHKIYPKQQHKCNENNCHSTSRRTRHKLNTASIVIYKFCNFACKLNVANRPSWQSKVQPKGLELMIFNQMECKLMCLCTRFDGAVVFSLLLFIAILSGSIIFWKYECELWEEVTLNY